MRKLTLGLAPLYTAFITFMSLGNNRVPHIEVSHIDKVYHATAYIVMFLLWYLFFNKNDVVAQAPALKSRLVPLLQWNRMAVVHAALTSLIIGALLELGQGFISQNRTMDVLDMVANSFGIIVAILMLWIFSEKFRSDIS